jgi:hypothetical protein
MVFRAALVWGFTLAVLGACDAEAPERDGNARPRTNTPLSDGGAPHTAQATLGAACKGLALPGRTQPLPQVVGVSSEQLPDGGTRELDAAVPEIDPLQFPGTPLCIVDGANPDGFLTWTCDHDGHCPTGAYCDGDENPTTSLATCRPECDTDADCGGRLCCGGGAQLTCVDEDGVRGCHCDVVCLNVHPFDGGASHLEPSTCGPCQGWCCGTECLNLANDDRNCGACGHACGGDSPYCEGGKCSQPECSASNAGVDPSTPACARCCGAECCGPDERCCGIPGQLGSTLECHPIAEPCPFGCLDCMCAAPETPIATADGERAIAELAVGDLVWSLERGHRVLVPIVRVNRTPVSPTHAMVRVVLSNGQALRMSPGHPTADGQTFADLAPGDELGGLAIDAVELVPYDQPFTFDILPGSASGVYFANGAAVGSTLHQQSLE